MIAFFRRVFIQDVRTWGIAFVLAVLVWGLLLTETVMDVDAAVLILLPPPDPDIVAPDPRILDQDDRLLEGNRVKVVLRGPRGLIKTLDTKDLRMTPKLDWKEPTESPHRLRLQGSDISPPVPDEVKVIFSTPEVRVRFEPMVEDVFPLRPPAAEGEPAPGYVLEQIKVVPDKAKARVPRPDLERLMKEGISLAPLSIANRAEDVVVGSADPADAAVRLREPVTIRAVIVVRKVKKEFKDLPIRLLFGPDFDLAVAVAEIDLRRQCVVIVEGKETVVRDLQGAQIRVYALVDRPTPVEASDQFTARLQWHLLLPTDQLDEAVVLSIDPPEVTIKTRRR